MAHKDRALDLPALVEIGLLCDQHMRIVFSGLNEAPCVHMPYGIGNVGLPFLPRHTHSYPLLSHVARAAIAARVRVRRTLTLPFNLC